MRRRLVAAAAGMLIALALVEVVLRSAFGYHGIADPPIFRHDPELGWALLPNAHALQSQLDFAITIDTDRLGLRVPRENRGDGAAARRVAVLGDSFAFGWGVNGTDMFSTALERELRAGGRPYRVRTLGVPGYSTDQEYLQWRRLSPELQADAVVLLFHESDLSGNVEDSVLMGRVRYFKPRFQLLDGRLHAASTDARGKEGLPPRLWDRLKGPLQPLASYALAQTAFRKAVPVPDRAADDAAGRPLTDALLAALDEDVTSRHAYLLVALIPADPATTSVVKRICETHQIAFVDLAPAFRGQSGVELPYDGHWNARGHLIAARAVAAVIARRSP